MRTSRDKKAFTLVELLVALIVTAILLSAVATLAYAMNSASQISEDVLSQQSRLRHTTLRISELVRNCRLICAAPGNDLAIWKTDTNGDGQINLNELAYLERGDTLTTLQLSEFDSSSNPTISLADLGLSTKKAALLSTYTSVSATLLTECKNVDFTFDSAPPFTQFVTVSFDLTEDGADRHYEVSAALRCWAGNLLNDAGDALVADDD